MDREGFTLIELMLAVAIMGILAAIAVPMLGTATRKAREATTKGNLATLRAVIAQAYTGNDGLFPANLGALVPLYLKEIPLKDTPPYHVPGNSVGAGNMANMIPDRNDWYFDNDTTDAQYGQVFVNCVHADLKGNAWTSY